MINKDSRPAVAGHHARMANVIVFVAIVMALSARYDILTQSAHACTATGVDKIYVYENNNWVDRTNQTTYVAVHSNVLFLATPSPVGTDWPTGYPIPIWGDAAAGKTGPQIEVTFNDVGEKTVTAGPNTKTVTVIVVEVGLDVFNEHAGPKLDENNEVSPGSFVLINQDDDDGANGVDNSNEVIDGASDKLDMAKMQLNVQPAAKLSGVTIELSANGAANVRVFDESDNKVTLPQTISASKFASGSLDYYVEGLTAGDATFYLKVKNAGVTICEDTVKITVNSYTNWKAWPGGNNDGSLNPTETISSSDVGLSGAVDWILTHGGTSGATIVSSVPAGGSGSSATGKTSITIRYDTKSADSSFTKGVEVKGYATGANSKLGAVRRTAFKATWGTPNTTNNLDGDNTLRFSDNTGTYVAKCEFNYDGENGAEKIAAKIECIATFDPSGIDWAARGVSFVFGALASGSGYQCRAYREKMGAHGGQLITSSVRDISSYFAIWVVDGSSDNIDCLYPTTTKPNKLFRIDAPGIDANICTQFYQRRNYREFLQWHNGTEWTRCSPYSEWYVNITGNLPNCAKGTPNNHGSGATTEKVPNTKPVANAGNDQMVASGILVQLNGSASSDADNDVLTYSWTQTAGPAVTLSGATASQPTFTAPTVGTTTVLTFELKVKDGTQSLGSFAPVNYESDPDSVSITVNP